MTTFKKRPSSPARLGFSLIELLIVITLLGILAVSVGPRLLSPDRSANQATVSAQLLGLLRAQQQNAMQDTVPAAGQGYCVRIESQRFGLLNDCDGPLPAVFAEAYQGIASSEVDPSLNFSSSLGTPIVIHFNALGCAALSAGAPCADGGIDIAMNGATVACVGMQGYIRRGACL